MHKTLRLVAGYYRKAARSAVVVLMAFTLFGSGLAIAETGSSHPLLLTVNNFGVYPGACGLLQDSVGGSVLVSGNWNGTVTFSGKILLIGMAVGSPVNDSIPLASTDFVPSNLSYPTKNTANFTAYGTACFDSEPTWTGWIAASSGGRVLGNSTLIGGSPFSYNNPTYRYIVELPMFNDTMLGAAPSCHRDDPNVSFMYPCSLPLGGYYNYVAFIAVAVAGVGLLVSMASAQFDEKERKKNQVLNLIVVVVFAFAFPAIYNQVAALLNYLNASIIAGPTSSNIPSDLNRNINTVWGAAVPNTGSVLNLFLDVKLMTLAGWLISLFTYIGVYVLGIIRLWLLAAMIVAFPVSLAIKEIPFARKLSNMIEDTFYGIVLASLMSAIIIGLAANIIGTTSSGNLPSTSIFGGGDVTFVASIALLTAVFMPSILAPLTGTLMQTGQQMAMAAGSVAALSTIGGAMGGIGGFTSGAMSPATLSKAGITAEQFGAMSTGQRLAMALQQGNPLRGIGGALSGGFRNVGVAAAMGVTSGFGMGQLPKVIGRIAPMSTPGAMGYEAAQRLGVQVQAQQQQEAGTTVPMMSRHFGNIMSSGLAGRGISFDWVPDRNGTRYSPVDLMTTGPEGGPDFKVAANHRSEWIRLTLPSHTKDFASALKDHGHLTEAQAKNEHLVRGLAAGVHEQLSKLKDPLETKDPNAVKAIQNLINWNEATAHRTR